MAKITIKQAQELLQQAGVTHVEVVADETTADKDVVTEDLLVEIDTARKEVLKPQIEAELTPEMEKRITGKISGSFRAAMRRVFKEANVPEKDLKDLTEEKALELIKEKYNGTMSQDTEALRTQLTEMATAHELALTAKDSEHAKVVEELNTKYIDRDIQDNLFGIIDAVPKLGGDKQFLTAGFMNYLKERYHVVFDSEGKVTKLRMKDNKETPVYNEKKTAEITPKELATDYLEKVGALAKDNRHVAPTSTLTNPSQQQQAVIVEQPEPSPVSQQVAAAAAWANQQD